MQRPELCEIMKFVFAPVFIIFVGFVYAIPFASFCSLCFSVENVSGARWKREQFVFTRQGYTPFPYYPVLRRQATFVDLIYYRFPLDGSDVTQLLLSFDPEEYSHSKDDTSINRFRRFQTIFFSERQISFKILPPFGNHFSIRMHWPGIIAEESDIQAHLNFSYRFQ